MEIPKGCNETLSEPYPDDGRLYCRPIFDTVRCWGHTAAGTRAFGDCPHNHPKSKEFTQNGYSFKDCTQNGSWFAHPDRPDRPWTNYTTCIHPEKTHTIINVFLIGYTVSVLLLVISFIVFSLFRQLKCTRVSMHKHLFMSFILSGLLWILYYKVATLDVNVSQENPLWCRVLHVLTQYATLCNYAWMLCEGLYLQAIIALAFTNQKRLYILCCFLGWCVPLLPVTIYTSIRATGSNQTELESCWALQTVSMWILMGPIVFSLVLNFGFLVNILRILISKLRAVNTNESHQYRRTAHACLILIPLLGVQYIIMPLHPQGDTFIYDIVKAILVSFQGAFVALLFCFLNGEVMQCIKKHVEKCIGRYSRKSTTHAREKNRKKPIPKTLDSKPPDYSAIPLNDVNQRQDDIEIHDMT